MEAITDPEFYNSLRTSPFESVETAQNAVSDFFAEVRVLRAKYGIADATVVVQVPAVQNGQTMDFIQSYHNGNAAMCPVMLAEVLSRYELNAINCVMEANALKITPGQETLADLIAFGGMISKDRALDFIKSGEVSVNREVVREDMPLPAFGFILKVKDATIQIPGATEAEAAIQNL